jgi:hypothetical protein
MTCFPEARLLHWQLLKWNEALAKLLSLRVKRSNLSIFSDRDCRVALLLAMTEMCFIRVLQVARMTMAFSK